MKRNIKEVRKEKDEIYKSQKGKRRMEKTA